MLVSFRLPNFYQNPKNSYTIFISLLSIVYTTKKTGFPYFGPDFFFPKYPYSLRLSKGKTKAQYGKNTTLTPTKIMPTK